MSAERHDVGAILPGVSLGLSPEALAVIAEQVAAILAERQAEPVVEGYLDVPGACEFLACKRDRIYALVSAGRIPHHRDGSRLLFDRAELHAFVRAGGALRP